MTGATSAGEAPRRSLVVCRLSPRPGLDGGPEQRTTSNRRHTPRTRPAHRTSGLNGRTRSAPSCPPAPPSPPSTSLPRRTCSRC
ncbi:MAG: hypothetical protein AVDCRST_MAG11-3420 [uncultured Gemmatimonadaceae bacterium]|uniref:Uncharacterized protein n=1 Tax=uncultured Gemmatimonadaceae bacterium TaxID=246130 RepID=A0A6J4M3W5_9BACT|nr:MAG: hypothetical protein AVDCRST_MAG11-3420 [uncultured Gemmatimonadaceae bacterium]